MYVNRNFTVKVVVFLSANRSLPGMLPTGAISWRHAVSTMSLFPPILARGLHYLFADACRDAD
jgi:hypothetical protein